MLIIFLSVSLFQSLLALEKILIGLVLLFICLFALWFFSFPALQYTSFWLFNNNIINKGVARYVAPLVNFSILSANQSSPTQLHDIENQFNDYCRLVLMFLLLF